MTTPAATIPSIELPGLADASRRAASAGEAAQLVGSLTRNHYENFPVLTRLVPTDLRADFAAVYAYCRTTDDLGDETGIGEAARARSLELLGMWRAMLRQCFDFAQGRDASPPSHPVFVALASTIRRHQLPDEPFHHLIDAFEQDQRVLRYESWAQLLDYCTRSADPVGRIILRLAGRRPSDPDWADLLAMSDATCTALQLTNFWQDVRRDLIDRDRVYLPSADTGISGDELRSWLDPRGAGGEPANRLRFIHALRPLITRTRELFDRGRPLPAGLGGKIGRVVWLFGAGGERVLNAVERSGCTTLWHRPTLGPIAKAALVARAGFLKLQDSRGGAA